MKTFNRPSFNLRRTGVSLAVATALAIAAQGSFAQSLVVNSSTSTVDLGGASGASFGPDTTTVIGTVTNSGTDQATGSADGVDTAVTVNNWDNPNGSAIIAGSGGVGVMNTGNIVAMTNEGAIKGTIGIDNKNTLQSLINAVGGSIGDGMTGLYGIVNEAGATIGLLKDNGGLIVGLSTGVAYVNNAGHIVTLDEEGNESSTSSSMQAAFINQVTGRIDQFTIGANARLTMFGTAAGLINLGNVQQVTVGGVFNASGDALVNGSTTNTTATIGGVSITGILESATGQGGANGIHNYAQMGDVTETSTGSLYGSLQGTAAINNESSGVIGKITLDGHSGAEGYVVLNKGITGDVQIGGQSSASMDSVVKNAAGASMGTFTTDRGSSVSTLGTANTNAVVQNDGTMAGMALNGTVASTNLNGVGVVNTATGTITNGITVGGSVSGKSGIENDGNLPTLDVQAGGTVNGSAIAGGELNNGTTAVTVAGVIGGSGAADALQVTNPGTVATATVEGNGSLRASGTGNGLTVGGGATANVTVQDNANIEAGTSGDAVDVKNAGTVNLTMTGRNAQVQNLGTGSAIVGEQGSNLNVNATGYSAGGAGPDITAVGSAPTIDLAGTASLNLDALVSNTTNSTALQIESTGNLTSFTNQGVIEGAVKNYSANPLVIHGASSYTDGNSTNGELGLFTGTGTSQSEIDSSAGVTLASGYAVLNDTVNAPNFNVASGATLVSYGQVAVNGNFNVADGGSLVSQVLGTSSYGQWNVIGNTTFAGTTALKLAAYNTFGFADGQRYTIVTTTGTASYNLAGISTSVVGYTGHVTTTQVGNNLVVMLGSGSGSGGGTSTPSNPSSPSAPTSPSNPSNPTSPTPPSSPTAASSVAGLTQTSVAATNGVVRYTGWNSAGLLSAENTVLAIEQNGTARQVTQAGTQLAPIPHAQAGNAILAINDAAMGVVSDRAEALRAAKQAGAATPSGVQTWGRAFGGAQQRGSTDGGTFGEVSGSNLTFGGLQVGADKALNDAVRVGGAFTYAHGQSTATGDASGQSLGVNTFGFALYQDWTKGRAYVNVTENASVNRFTESRSIDLAGVSAGSASGHFSGTSFGARVEAGLPFALRNGIDVTPYVALGVQHISLGSYTETDGGSGVGLNVNGASYTSVRSTLGVKVSKAFDTKVGTVVPYAKLAFVHEFAGTPSDTTAVFNGDSTGETTFTTVSASPVRNIADLTVGATLYRAKGLSLNAQVNVQAGSGYTAVAGGVQAKWSF